MASIETRITKALRAAKRKPITVKELAKKTGVNRNQRPDFLKAVDRLKAQNLVIDRNGKLMLAESMGLVRGEIIKVSGTFGFARPEGGDKDVFVPGRMLMGSMPGDTVLLRVRPSSGELMEGEVFKVLTEAPQRASARLEIDEDGARIFPDHQARFPLDVSPSALNGARDGDKVLYEITRRGSSHRDHVVRILQAFGSADSAAACCHAILAANGVAETFPHEVLAEAATVAEQGIHPKEIEGRLDLRDQLIFTIDGADSKDLDDAISLRELAGGGWELGVHIADVSHYVRHNSPLDTEAFSRGTSVYYADSVIPMLPEALSNGICSLNPQEDRLAFSALIRLDAAGKIIRKRFAKSVIRSRIKGIYSEVNQILEGTADKALYDKYSQMLDTLEDMRKLAALLTKTRFARGAVNLETTESKILLDADGRAADVQPRKRGASEMLIEEFMLVANEAAAGFALEKELPFIYRVHENPAPDKITDLFAVLEQMGVPGRLPKGGITSGQLAAVMDKARGTDMERVASSMILRSMAKARYSENNTGHFGLALADYTHFTSPIRRYPDLVIHRILTAYLASRKKDRVQQKFSAFAAEAAAHSSQREVAAMTAERDCEDCYKAEYMRRHLGETMEGVISSVTSFGIYVQLPNTVEGLVHISRFPAGEWLPDGNLSFSERHTGRRLRLGDAVSIVVAAADVSAGSIDFSMAE